MLQLYNVSVTLSQRESQRISQWFRKCISHHFGEFASGNSVHWRGRVISRMNNVYRVKELLNVGYGHTRLNAPDLVRSRKLNNCEILWDSLWLRVTETFTSPFSLSFFFTSSFYPSFLYHLSLSLSFDVFSPIFVSFLFSLDPERSLAILYVVCLLGYYLFAEAQESYFSLFVSICLSPHYLSH